MRYSRIFRLVMRFFLLILASTMSLVSFLGGYSALIILSDDKNIDIGYSMTGDMLNINDTSFELEIEFEINNIGYYDLEDLEIEGKFYLRYDYVNYSGDGLNRTMDELLFEGEKDFGTIKSGESMKDGISIKREDIKTNVTKIAIFADKTKDPKLIAKDIIIKGKYSMSLISFKIEIEEFNIGEYVS